MLQKPKHGYLESMYNGNRVIGRRTMPLDIFIQVRKVVGKMEEKVDTERGGLGNRI
jgi:hypothetical protein